MIRHKRAEQVLQIAVFTIIAAVCILQIAVCRGLYADGTDGLIHLLDGRQFNLYDWHRLSSTFVLQWPVVLALYAGVDSMTALRFIFSGWLLLLPVLLWLLALWEVRKDFLFWPFVMLFAFVYYTTCFLIVSEFNLCFGLVACCLAVLLRRGPLGFSDRALLLVAAALLPLSYAATLFFGPALLALLYMKRPRRRRRAKKDWFRLALAFFFVTSAVTGLWEVLTPRDGSNFASARNPAMVFMDRQFWVALLYGLTVSASLFLRAPFRPYVPILCAALLGFFLFTWGNDSPFYSYGVRVYVAFIFLFAALGLAWFRRRGYRSLLSARRMKSYNLTLFYIAPVFAVFIFLSVHDADLSLKYAAYLDQFRAEVNSREWIVPYEISGLEGTPGDRLFGRMWTYPLMSLVLRDNEKKAIILNPSWFHGYQMFDPYQHIPDMSRYYKP